MDISSDKQAKSHLDLVKKGKSQERSKIPSDSNTKQSHKDYVKAKIDKT